MKVLLSISLCLLLFSGNSTAVTGQENEDSRQENVAQYLWAIKRYNPTLPRYNPSLPGYHPFQSGEQERLNLFSQSLETMARNLDPLERMSNELEVDGFEEMAQAAETFMKAAKPFVDRLDEAARKQSASRLKSNALMLRALESQISDSNENPEVQEPETEKKALMSPGMTGNPAVEENIRAAWLEKMQKVQQEAMMKTAMEYYAARRRAAQTEAKEEIGLFQEVVGSEATAKIATIEDRLTRLESLLEKVLSKLDEKQE